MTDLLATLSTRRMSKSNYGAVVSAEINRCKICPPAARKARATGSVGVIFTVGASGAIVSHRISRSSGNAALDAAARRMMASAHPPPPPGGRFHGSVVIRFNVGG